MNENENKNNLDNELASPLEASPTPEDHQMADDATPADVDDSTSLNPPAAEDQPEEISAEPADSPADTVLSEPPVSEEQSAASAATPPETSEPRGEAQGTASTDRSESAAAFSTPTAQQAPVPPLPNTRYRWVYAEQRTHDRAREKKRRSTGLWIYALVMTGVFALSFGLLLGVMFMTGGELPTIQFGESATDENGQLITGSDYADSLAIEKTKASVVLIEVTTPSGGGSGTGIILSADGYIATNHHVIENGTTIRVRFYDGSYATAELRGSSEVDDLAVIKVDRSNLTPATFAHSSECYVGQTVYAIGNPSGAEMAWTTTRGCISYVDRELKIYKDDGTLEKKLKMIQTDAMVNPGNSGGPLVNTKGEVVGIVSMKLADGYEGIGFAIPSDGASEILNAIIKDGNADNINSNVSYERPVIGIVGVYMEGGCHYIFEENRVVEVTESYAQQNPEGVMSPAVSGIYVRSLTEGTDAAIKLQEGDIITAVNEIQATNMNVLMNEINEHYAGDEVMITYYRNGLYTDVTITLSAAKE